MPKITVDFSKAGEGFEALPEDEYPCVIESATLKESSRSPHPFIELVLVVAEGEYEGRKLWSRLSLHPNALFRTKETFENLGFLAEGEELELDVDEDTDEVLEPPFVGLPVIAPTTQEVQKEGKGKGKLRNVVDVLLASESAAPKKAGAKKTTGSAAKKPGGKRGRNFA